MIENGTRVDLELRNEGSQSLMELLNHIGGQVVKSLKLPNGIQCYLVAADEKHLDDIDKARQQGSISPFPIDTQVLKAVHPKEFKGDGRYYVLAFENEVTPV